MSLIWRLVDEQFREYFDKYEGQHLKLKLKLEPDALRVDYFN